MNTELTHLMHASQTLMLALEKSEQRSRRWERLFFGACGILTLTLLWTGVHRFELIGNSWATPDTGYDLVKWKSLDKKTQEDEISFLQYKMYSMFFSKEMMETVSNVQSLVKDTYSSVNYIKTKIEEKQINPVNAINAMGDMMTLIARIKQDSDVLRVQTVIDNCRNESLMSGSFMYDLKSKNLMYYPKNCQKITGFLGYLEGLRRPITFSDIYANKDIKDSLDSNEASPAIMINNAGPAISKELLEMNANMRVMAGSMGSTMGRMGSMMPF